MFNHAPPDYACPFCLVVAGGNNPQPHAGQADVVLRTGAATAFVSSSWWPNNPGHVLVVPDSHVENLYDLTPEIGAQVQDAARQIALAFKAVYRCAGVSTRQHNEPAGGQEVWHYHLHVFPRHDGDRLYGLDGERRTAGPEERAHYAEELRRFFRSAHSHGRTGSGLAGSRRTPRATQAGVIDERSGQTRVDGACPQLSRDDDPG